MDKILEPSNLREIFRGTQNLGGFQQYADRLRLLHHRYLEARLMPSNGIQNYSVEELLRFVEDADYLATQYTNPLVVDPTLSDTKDDIPSRQIVQDALTLAGTIYEFLGDIVGSVEQDAITTSVLRGELFREDNAADSYGESQGIGDQIGKSSFLYIKSALCYGLARYESRIQVILGRLSDRLERPEGTLTEANLKRWADYLFCCLLSRRLTGVDLISVQQKFKDAVLSIRNQNKIDVFETRRKSLHEIAEMEESLSFIEAILAGAEAFEWGDESLFRDAIQSLKKSADATYRLGDYETLWITRTCAQVFTRMWADSPWTRLREVIPHRLYLQSLVSSGIVTLWSSQIAALEMQSRLGSLNGGYLDDRVKRVVVNMPTSAGKTLLAELAIAHHCFNDASSQCVYVAPSRALCDQICKHLQDRLSPFGIGVTAIVNDGEASDYESIIFKKTNVIVVTPEKLTYLFRQRSRTILGAKLFIFDELQTLSKDERGWVFEQAITLLLKHPEAQQAKMLFLSAVMPNHLQVQEWVDPEKTADTISELWQPTRLLKGVVTFRSTHPKQEGPNALKGSLIYVRSKGEVDSPLCIEDFIESTQSLKWEDKKGKYGPFRRLSRDASHSDDEIIHAVAAADRFARLGPVLAYCPKKAQAVRFCQLAVARGVSREFPALRGRQEDDFRDVIDFIKGRLPLTHPLVKALEQRIAFHHGGLPKDVRNEIEDAFRHGLINLLAATSTLVEGVNFPVKTLLLSDYCMRKFYDFKNKQWQRENELSLSDFRNIAGRAGRALFETEGQVVFLQSTANFPDSPFNMPFDDKYKEYLGVEADSHQLDVTSAFESYIDEGVLEDLNQLVEAVDQGVITDEKLLFDTPDYKHASSAAVVSSLQSLSLLLRDQQMVGDDEESFINIFQGTFWGKSYADQVPQVSAFCHRSGRAIARTINNDYSGLYAQTGLKIRTCRELMTRTQEFWDRKSFPDTLYRDLDAAALDEIADVIFDLGDSDLTAKSFYAAREGTGSKTKKTVADEKILFRDWILHHDVNKLMSAHFGSLADESWRAEQFVNYTQTTLAYSVPWVLSAFWAFSKYIVAQKVAHTADLELNTTPFGRELLLLPSYAKFGVNTPAAAFFSSLGISPATLARQLGELYGSADTNRFDYFRMIDWLQTVDLKMVEVNGEIQPSSYIRRLATLLANIRSLDKPLASRHVWEVRFFVAGWTHYEGESLVTQLKPGDPLALERDSTNKHDANAVRVMSSGGQMLGYVPRSGSRDVSIRLERLRAEVEEVNLHSPIYRRLRIRCFSVETR